MPSEETTRNMPIESVGLRNPEYDQQTEGQHTIETAECRDMDQKVNR
jgi:hypothetical protein